MLKPESIAVVGASRDKPGASWVDMFGQLVEFGYRGRLYPINPKADVIRGHKAYAGLTDLPEPVDLVIIGLSAPHRPLDSPRLRCHRESQRPYLLGRFRRDG